MGNFNLGISDTSSMEYGGYFVSLNIAAKVCPTDSNLSAAQLRGRVNNKPDDGFSVDHHAEMYDASLH